MLFSRSTCRESLRELFSFREGSNDLNFFLYYLILRLAVLYQLRNDRLKGVYSIELSSNSPLTVVKLELIRAMQNQYV